VICDKQFYPPLIRSEIHVPYVVYSSNSWNLINVEMNIFSHGSSRPAKYSSKTIFCCFHANFYQKKKGGLCNPIFGFKEIVSPFGDSLAQKQDFSKYTQSSI
jgi:hypothetical protein